MKKSNLWLMALALAAFTSCSKDEVTGSDGSIDNVPSGIETYASFNFQVEGTASNTRAASDGMTDDATAEANPVKIKDIRMLIFDGNNNGEGVLVNNVAINGTEATKLTTVKTTSGAKRIYVVVNAEDKAGLKAKLAGLTEKTATLNDLYKLATDGKDIGADDMGPQFYELIKAELPLSNIADVNSLKTLQPNISADDSKAATGDATKNNFSFDVQRMIAKGSMQAKLKDKDADGNFTTKDGIYQIDQAGITFGVRNINRSSYIIQQFGSDLVDIGSQAHTANTVSTPQAPFFNQFNAIGADDLKKIATYQPYYFGGYPIAGAKAVAVTLVDGTNVGAADAFSKKVYYSGNSNNLSIRGTTTYFGISVRTKGIAKDYIAKSIKTDDLANITSDPADANYTYTAGAAAGANDFWVVRNIPADIKDRLKGTVRVVFTNADVAFEAMAVIAKNSASVSFTTNGFKPTEIWTAAELQAAYAMADGTAGALNAADKATVDNYLAHYKDGLSYYRLNMYETADNGTRRHFVRRNHHYASTITSFATIGDPDEGDLDKDPDKPVDSTPTNVTAVIKVVDWHNVAMSDDL